MIAADLKGVPTEELRAELTRTVIEIYGLPFGSREWNVLHDQKRVIRDELARREEANREKLSR